VVNVHIPYEGEVEGTDAFIPYNDIDALTASLPDKDARIVLYCRSGRMSAEASQKLAELGYTQVWDVPGGMNAWSNSGREIVNR
jgi:rhodanese-related sulfurtransferase